MEKKVQPCPDWHALAHYGGFSTEQIQLKLHDIGSSWLCAATAALLCCGSVAFKPVRRAVPAGVHHHQALPIRPKTELAYAGLYYIYDFTLFNAFT